MQKSKEKQKKFLGTVPKKCQLVETFWDCPEISKTNNNGITLIALIITVIVMLILVGVTINVALNGGLFTKARQAANDYQYQEDYEILQAAVVASLDENLQIPNAETLQNNLPSGWTVTGEDAGPFTATSPSGNVFTVDKDGTITGQNGGTQTPGGDEPEDPEVPEEPETPTVTLPEELKVGKEFTMDADQDGTEETWIVLYDSTAEHLNENEIEVISKDTMGSLTLGEDDTVAIENAIDLDGNDTVEDIEIALRKFYRVQIISR